MKRILLVLFLLICNLSFSQSKIDFKFYNSCIDSIVSIDYEFLSLENFDLSYSTYERDTVIEVEACL